MEWPDFADLTPYDRNAKRHPDGQVYAIARLIRAYDFDQPILIDEDDVVPKGKGRRLAALKLGLARISQTHLGGVSSGADEPEDRP